jgi:ABC-type transporter Mla subunit MlaD
MTDDKPRSAQLDEVLTRAVDRQIAEQRALRQALDQLREAVREFGNRPAARVDMSSLDQLREAVRELGNRPAARVDLSPLEDRIKDVLDPLDERFKDLFGPLASRIQDSLSPMEDRIQSALRAIAERPMPAQHPPPDLAGLEERVQNAIHSSVAGATESSLAALSDQLRSFREAVVPRLEQATEANAAVRAVSEEIGSIREVVGGVSTDIEGIAQALIDFNGGLRQWATGLDETVGSIRLTVGEIYAVATQPRPSDAGETADQTASLSTSGASGNGQEKPAGIEERIKETAELSEYLADQIEDLDGLMGRLTELPQQLEGVVSQALKRTLTARAKLDREAETALDDVLEALDEHVNQLSTVLERFEQEEDHIRKIALEQVELTSRIESLQSTFVDRIDRIDNERRRGEEAIAVAIDRSARGLTPRALESLSKSTRRRKSAPVPRKQAKASSRRSDGRGAARKSSAAQATTAKQPKRKAKRAPRKAKRQDWTPLPDSSDDTRA